MPVLDNARHEAFVRALVDGKTQRQAYYDAYPGAAKMKPETVDNKACKLANSDEIRVRYVEIQENSEKEFVWTIAQKRERLRQIAEDPDSSNADIVRAIDTDNKMMGAYTTKMEVSTRQKEQDKLDSIIGQLWKDE